MYVYIYYIYHSTCFQLTLRFKKKRKRDISFSESVTGIFTQRIQVGTQNRVHKKILISVENTQGYTAFTSYHQQFLLLTLNLFHPDSSLYNFFKLVDQQYESNLTFHKRNNIIKLPLGRYNKRTPTTIALEPPHHMV